MYQAKQEVNVVPEQAATSGGPSTSEVLRALADEVEGLQGNPDRITVEAGSPKSFVARVYTGRSDDYEGFELRFD